MQVDARLWVMKILIEVVYALRVEAAGPADKAVYFITFL